VQDSEPESQLIRTIRLILCPALSALLACMHPCAAAAWICTSAQHTAAVRATASQHSLRSQGRTCCESLCVQSTYIRCRDGESPCRHTVDPTMRSCLRARWLWRCSTR
jgi:hypothetical protein